MLPNTFCLKLNNWDFIVDSVFDEEKTENRGKMGLSQSVFASFYTYIVVNISYMGQFLYPVKLLNKHTMHSATAKKTFYDSDKSSVTGFKILQAFSRGFFPLIRVNCFGFLVIYYSSHNYYWLIFFKFGIHTQPFACLNKFRRSKESTNIYPYYVGVLPRKFSFRGPKEYYWENPYNGVEPITRKFWAYYSWSSV